MATHAAADGEFAPRPARGSRAAAVSRWVDDVIIGRGLCPFAENARARTRVVELAEVDVGAGASAAKGGKGGTRGRARGFGGSTRGEEARLDALGRALVAAVGPELELLAAQDRGEHATTLVALPPDAAAELGFEGYMERVVQPLQEIADREDGFDIQVVPFHPDAEYGLEPSEEWATRAPHACLHLLRSGDVLEAQERWASEGLSTDTIGFTNAQRLRVWGEEACAHAVRSCAQEPSRVRTGINAAEGDASRTPERARALLEEVQAAGAEASKIELRRVSPDEWGAVALDDIDWDEPLLCLPRACVRTALDAAELGLGTAQGLNRASALAALLVHERALARGGRSSLPAYVGMLPPDANLRARHPLLASEAQLMDLLGGERTMLGTEALARAREASQMAKLVAKALHELAPDLHYHAPEELEESALCAVAAVSSRAFMLDLPKEGPTLALCPLADMLNHSSQAGSQQRACLQWDEDVGAAVIRASRDYEEGEEVFDSFGQTLSPVDSFLRYGFVEGAGADDSHAAEGTAGALSSASDRLSLPARLLGEPACASAARMVAAAGLRGASLVLGAEGPDDVGVAYVMALEASEGEMKAAGWIVEGSSPDEEDAASADVIGALCACEEPWAMALEARATARLGGVLRGLLDGGGYEASREALAGVGAHECEWAPHAAAALASEERALRAATRVVSGWAAREGGARKRAERRVVPDAVDF